MPQLRRLNLPAYPSFITTKTLDNRPLFRDRVLAEMLVSILYFCRTQRWLYLLAFVVMPDHLHLVIAPHQRDIVQNMQSIKSYSAHRFRPHLGGKRRVWQESFFDYTIPDAATLRAKVEYIHANPVRANLAAEPEEYPFSSANPAFDTDLSRFL